MELLGAAAGVRLFIIELAATGQARLEGVAAGLQLSIAAAVAEMRGKNYLGVAHGNDWGDWLSFGTKTPLEYVDTAYFAYSAKLMADMAHAIGLTLVRILVTQRRLLEWETAAAATARSRSSM